jgi:hypothetical protein
MLELLRAAAFNHGGHRGEGAVLGLRQSAQVASGDGRAGARAGAEEAAVALVQRRELCRQAIEQRFGQS